MKFQNSIFVLCISALLNLTACGQEQKTSNDNAMPVGLMASSVVTEDTDQTNSNSEITTTKRTRKPTAPFTGAPVNINTATADELVSVLKGTGVGKAKVKNIIAYREEHNGFKSIDELNQVKGIGDKTLEKMRERVTLTDKPTTQKSKPQKESIEEKGD
ncbi:helix-hairpin-helix domain-containing protein [Simonsiella muelleri]|uniref:ComEA family DNA-binding protein n=1 Tax=Simonsiella muelleri TaxID=72 RepID=UPI0028D7CE55|nr:helix-hairpin-helix domain-containing protein [Simonsiella muelleri]